MSDITTFRGADGPVEARTIGRDLSFFCHEESVFRKESLGTKGAQVLLRSSISESPPPPRPGTAKRSYAGQSSTDVWLGARLEVLNSEHRDLVADAHERRCSK